jgi:hypothetical protein
MTRYGLSRKEAAVHYRAVREHLDRPAMRADIKNHPKIAARYARHVKAIRVPKRPIGRPIIPLEEFPPAPVEEEEEEIEVEGSEDGVYI